MECQNHPDKDAQFRCVGCGQYFCSKCVKGISGEYYCKTCENRLRLGRDSDERRVAAEAAAETLSRREGVEFASFWRRFMAYLIDGLVLASISKVLSIMIAQDYYGWLAGVIGIVYIVGFWTWRGQTPGKMMLNVKVITTEGSSISFGRAILRCFGYIVSSIILCLGYLMIARDSKKQGLHDKIAGTYVVKLT